MKSIKFENFRNIDGIYYFDNKLNIIFGENNSGKTNILDGIRLAFSLINGEYFRVNRSDFKNNDDSKEIRITVELDKDDIPSLNIQDSNNNTICGFIVIVQRRAGNKYRKMICFLNGTLVNEDILCSDPNLPNICSLPLVRSEDIYSNGLITGISHFIDSEEKYKDLKNESNKYIKEQMKERIEKFKQFCIKFNQELDVDFTEPRLIDEKIRIINGKADEYDFNIGSGYRSIANIILNTLENKKTILLIDEIENNLHPSLIRTLLREVNSLPNICIIATTHSPVVVNEVNIDNLIYSKGIALSSIEIENKGKLNKFMHPGRAEILFADNVILVEGYSEEILLKKYIQDKKFNWTIVNVSGVMFEPYIELATVLKKKTIVISDNDISISDDGLQKSNRFNRLHELCQKKGIKLLETYNTLETDLYRDGLLSGFEEYLKPCEKNQKLMVTKNNKKTEIAISMIENNVDISSWHIVKEIEYEFKNN